MGYLDPQHPCGYGRGFHSRGQHGLWPCLWAPSCATRLEHELSSRCIYYPVSIRHGVSIEFYRDEHIYLNSSGCFRLPARTEHRCNRRNRGEYRGHNCHSHRCGSVVHAAEEAAKQSIQRCVFYQVACLVSAEDSSFIPCRFRCRWPHRTKLHVLQRDDGRHARELS